jgi:hypothetical protein
MHLTISRIGNWRLAWFFIKYCYTTTNSLNGLVNTGDMAEGLMTATGLQKPPVKHLLELGAPVQIKITVTNATQFSMVYSFSDIILGSYNKSHYCETFAYVMLLLLTIVNKKIQCYGQSEN